ncbi:hypothetical protein ACFVTC_02535 [Streptomyces sp. NPDC057950]|uniref:hypothetical protein n=1 Tax=Streptomyces sp. NPDC057950 TaxID=3346288 RepID=UPI0036F09D7A
MSRKARFWALAVTGLLLVTACSGADRPSAYAGGRLRTGLTDAERTLLGQAEQRLITECMRDQGFHYQLDPDPRAGELDAPERRFGLDDVAWARRHGYGLAEAAASGDREGKAAAAKGPEARYIAALPAPRRADFDRALNGTDRAAIVVPAPGRGEIFTSADGCQADARRQLYGDLRKWTEAKAAVLNLEYTTYADVVAEPRYAKALADWQACMKSRGHDYPSSSAAIGTVAKENRSDTAVEARRREVTVAVADAECNRAAGLARTGAGLQRKHVREAARHEFARQTRYYTQAVATALGRARSVVGSG